MRAVLMTAVGGPKYCRSPGYPTRRSPGNTTSGCGCGGWHQPGRLQARLRRDGRRVAARRPGLARCPGWWTAPARPWTRVRPGGEVWFCDGGLGPTPRDLPGTQGRGERYLARESLSPYPTTFGLFKAGGTAQIGDYSNPTAQYRQSASPITAPGVGRDQHPVRYRTRPRTGRSVPPDRNETVIFQEARNRQGDLKLFELSAICMRVTLRDREELYPISTSPKPGPNPIAVDDATCRLQDGPSRR